jgi:hypothetical protein
MGSIAMNPMGNDMKYRKLLDEFLGKFIEMTWEDKLSEKFRVQSNAESSELGTRSVRSGPQPKVPRSAVDTRLLKPKRKYTRRKKR